MTGGGLTRPRAHDTSGGVGTLRAFSPLAWNRGVSVQSQPPIMPRTPARLNPVARLTDNFSIVGGMPMETQYCDPACVILERSLAAWSPWACDRFGYRARSIWELRRETAAA